MTHNDKELSIANYKKSLELDPNNPNAKSRLAALTGEQKEVKVDPKIYDSYVGEYQLAPTFTVTITSENGKLMAQATGQSKFELFPDVRNGLLSKSRTGHGHIRKRCAGQRD